MHWKIVLILAVTFLAYLMIGGAVFQALEQTKETEAKTMYIEKNKKFLSKSVQSARYSCSLALHRLCIHLYL